MSEWGVSLIVLVSLIGGAIAGMAAGYYSALVDRDREEKRRRAEATNAALAQRRLILDGRAYVPWEDAGLSEPRQNAHDPKIDALAYGLYAINDRKGGRADG